MKQPLEKNQRSKFLQLNISVAYDGFMAKNNIKCYSGNGNGTFGYSLTSGRYGGNFKTFRTAVNKAGLRLLTIERYD